MTKTVSPTEITIPAKPDTHITSVQYYNDSTIEFSTYVNSSLSISDSLTLYNADSTWTEENIVGHFDTTVIYSLTFIDNTTIR